MLWYKNFEIWLIGSLILLIISLFFGIQSTNDLDDNIYRCNWTIKMKLQEFEGIVALKYIDKKNHNYPTIKVKNLEDTSKIKTFEFTNEKNGFFNYVKKGDLVFKAKDSLEVRVTRNEEEQIFVLGYGCESK